MKGKSSGDARVEMLEEMVERERERECFFFFWSPFCRFFFNSTYTECGLLRGKGVMTLALMLFSSKYSRYK